MNKEFILLDDGNMLVTDENGNMDKRYYGNGAQSELLSENKKELIENKLKEAKDKLISDKKAKKFSKDMIRLQPAFVLCVTGIAFLGGGLFNLSTFSASAFHAGTIGLIVSSVSSLISATYYSVIHNIYKKRVKQDKHMVEAIKKVKNDFEKENNIVKENEYTRGGVYPNQVFNLTKDTQIIESNLDDNIEDYYEKSLENSGMKLSLKRK